MTEPHYTKNERRNDQLTHMVTEGLISTTEYTEMTKRSPLDSSPLLATFLSYLPFSK